MTDRGAAGDAHGVRVLGRATPDEVAAVLVVLGERATRSGAGLAEWRARRRAALAATSERVASAADARRAAPARPSRR